MSFRSAAFLERFPENGSVQCTYKTGRFSAELLGCLYPICLFFQGFLIKSPAVHHLPCASHMATDLTIVRPQKPRATVITYLLKRVAGAVIGCSLGDGFGSLTGRIAVASLLLLTTAAAARAGTLTIAWDPSSDPSVVGYNVYWGTRSGQYNVGA